VSQELQSAMLSRFLKSRRAALSPADFGLPRDCRRRTPGLRREEVASLVGVSVSWYTWLEQGRSISVSASVLERLASVLQLDAAQREYLFTLVQRRPAPIVPPERVEPQEPSPLLRRTLDALNVPAVAMTYRWDLVAWNRYMEFFRNYSELPPKDRNLLRLLVRDPMHKANPDDYERKIRLATSRLRFDYSQVGDDPVLDELIRELCEACPLFDHYWNDSTDIGPAESEGTVLHPKLGRFNFEHSVYVPKSDAHLRLVIYFPQDEAAAAKLAEIAEQLNGRTTRSREAPARIPSLNARKRRIA